MYEISECTYPPWLRAGSCAVNLPLLLLLQANLLSRHLHPVWGSLWLPCPSLSNQPGMESIVSVCPDVFFFPIPLGNFVP